MEGVEGRTVEDLDGVKSLQCRKDFDIQLGFGIRVEDEKIVCVLTGDSDAPWGIHYPGGQYKEAKVDGIMIHAPETVWGTASNSNTFQFRWEHGADCKLVTDERHRLVDGVMVPYDQGKLHCEPNLVPR